jgi:phage-related protein
VPQRDLKVTLLGDDKTGSAFGSAARNADGFGSKISGVGKGLALAFGGAALAGIAGIGAAFVTGVRDAASYEKITNQLAQTLKSTGNAAGTSVAGLKAYAGELESMSGVDEELILSSQNVLATFTKVQNQVGEGNNVFDQASLAALNLSTTMGGDLQGATVLVGKALNDPIKGMAALGKAGVALTAEQKEQIKTMVASGDVMGAQKIILGELETQFGGAAKAAGQGLTGSIARAKDAFSDIFRTIATAVLPTLARFAEFIAGTLMPGIKGIWDLVVGGDFTGALADAFGWEEDSAVVDFLFRLRDGLIGVFDIIARGDFTGRLTEAFGWEEDSAIVGFLFSVREALIGLWGHIQTVGGLIRDNFIPVLAAVGAVLGTVLLVSIYSLAAAFVGLLSPVVLIMAGIAALAAGLAYAYQHSESFRAIIEQVAAFITGTVIPAFSKLVDWLQVQMAKAIAYVVSIWPQVSAAIKAAMETARVVVETALAVVQRLWETFGSTILTFVRSTFDNIKTVIGGALDVIKGIVNVFIGVFTGDWGRAWDGVKSITSGALDLLKGIVGQALDAIKAILSAAWGAIGLAAGAAWDGVKALIGGALEAVKSLFLNFTGPGLLIKHWDTIKAATSAAWEAVKSLVRGGIDAVVGFISGLGGRISGAVSGAGTWLADAGRRVIQGFIDGITGAFGRVRDTLARLTNLLPDWKGPADKDARLLYGAGKLVMGGFDRGLRDSFGDVRRTLGDATDMLGMGVGGTGYINARLGAGGRAPIAPAAVARNVTVHISGQVERLDEDRLMTLLARAERMAGVA